MLSNHALVEEGGVRTYSERSNLCFDQEALLEALRQRFVNRRNCADREKLCISESFLLTDIPAGLPDTVLRDS